jgi:tetratricopeptide (TPR) repeat protein
MYKGKLKEWGLSKYIRATEAVAIFKLMEERQAAGKSSQIILRGEKVDLDRVKNHVRRTRHRGKLERLLVEERAQEGETGARELVCRTPSPSPDTRSPTPGRLGAAEDVYRALAVYVDGSIAAGDWFVDDAGLMRSVKADLNWYVASFKDLWNRVDMASQLVGKTERLNLVKLLDPAFGYMANCVQDRYPRTLTYMVSSCEVLRDRGRGDLANMFVTHLAGLSDAMYGPNHPQTRLWQRLMEVYAEEHDDVMVERFFQLLLKQLRQQSHRSEHFELAVFVDYYDSILAKRDLETQELSLRREVERLKTSKNTSSQVGFLVLRYANIVKDLALLQGRWADAEVSLDCLEEYGDWDGGMGLQARAETALAREDFETAEKYYRAACAHIDVNPLYKDESWANEMMKKLESVLISTGKVEEARTVLQTRLDRLRKLESEEITH